MTEAEFDAFYMQRFSLYLRTETEEMLTEIKTFLLDPSVPISRASELHNMAVMFSMEDTFKNNPSYTLWLLADPSLEEKFGINRTRQKVADIARKVFESYIGEQESAESK